MTKNYSFQPPADPTLGSRISLIVSLAAVGLFLLVALAGLSASGLAGSSDTAMHVVLRLDGSIAGEIESRNLTPEGTLRLAFVEHGREDDGPKYEWWQLAEREDRSGYPRIDPQSGGSGLPGARGEDEDPAYYSESDYLNPELSSRIFQEEKYWLLDHPTHNSGFRFESWLVEREGPKEIVLLAGVSWGISVKNGEITALHHPQAIARMSRFDWHESLRISGFGSGWQIKDRPA